MEDRRVSYSRGNFSSIDVTKTDDPGEDSIGNDIDERIEDRSVLAGPVEVTGDQTVPVSSAVGNPGSNAVSQGRQRGRRHHARIKDVPIVAATPATGSVERSRPISHSVVQDDTAPAITDLGNVDVYNDSLDLAEFVIQTAIADEEEDVPGPHKAAACSGQPEEPHRETGQSPKPSGLAMATGVDDKQAPLSATDNADNLQDVFDAAPSETTAAGSAAAEWENRKTPIVLTTRDDIRPPAPSVDRRAGLKLSIPMIEEDSIPLIEATAEDVDDRLAGVSSAAATIDDPTAEEIDAPPKAQTAESRVSAERKAEDRDLALRKSGDVHPEGKSSSDADPDRSFPALSLKRLGVLVRRLGAGQPVKIVSGLSIIGALGISSWFIFDPAPEQQQRVIKAQPLATKTASQKIVRQMRPMPEGRIIDLKAGLIYQSIEKVELAALTAIGDMEFNITPSKAYRVIRAVKGDSFLALLLRADVDREEAVLAIRAMQPTYDPRRLQIGQEVKVDFSVAGAEPSRFLGYRFDLSHDRGVLVTRQQSGEFSATEIEKKYSVALRRVSGRITGSLFESGIRAGAPPQIMIQMIRLLSFEIDFQRDLHGDEEFGILFRSYADESGRDSIGEIVYALLTVQGRRHQFYLYPENKDGTPIYLNERGQQNRKALMKTPIDGARLTSNFGVRRHPILGYSKLHTGVDFGAPTGTPIYAAGDGTIVRKGWFGGYGRYIRIHHNKTYQTAYGHMSRFRSGLKVGSRVRQGETIGYVGSTGRSTGPHLHYEVFKNGKHVNPMTITLPASTNLDGRALQEFLSYRKEIDAQYAEMNNEKQKRGEDRMQTVKSDGRTGCKNGIRSNPKGTGPCN